MSSLAATGIGFPIPEDLLLLAGGYLIALDVFGWPATWALGVVGLMVSDVILFTAGRRLRHESIEGTRLERVLRPERVRAATAWFDRLGSPAIVAARFVPGSRAIVFVTAGLGTYLEMSELSVVHRLAVEGRLVRLRRQLVLLRRHRL